MEVIYGSVFLWGERVRPLLSKQHKQPCLPGASSHDIIAAQECSQAESSERKSSFHLSLSLPLSHSIPISFWKDMSIIYPPFPLLGKICFMFFSHRHSSATTLLKQASLILLLIRTVTDFNKTLIPKDLYFVAQLVPPHLQTWMIPCFLIDQSFFAALLLLVFSKGWLMTFHTVDDKNGLSGSRGDIECDKTRSHSATECRVHLLTSCEFLTSVLKGNFWDIFRSKRYASFRTASFACRQFWLVLMNGKLFTIEVCIF